MQLQIISYLLLALLFITSCSSNQKDEEINKMQALLQTVEKENQEFSYLTEEGDSFENIAKRLYQDQSKASKIKDLNPELATKTSFKAGVKLLIPFEGIRVKGPSLPKSMKKYSQVLNDLEKAKEAARTQPTEFVARTIASESLEARDLSRPEDLIYVAKGGEDIRWIAKSLFNDFQASSRIYNLNPGLVKGSTLEKGEKLTLPVNNLNINAKFLPTYLVDNFSELLGQKLEKQLSRSGKKKNQTKVKEGETIQMVSERIYQTTRYWPELYLINRERIPDYNHVGVGDLITYYFADKNDQRELASLTRVTPEGSYIYMIQVVSYQNLENAKNMRAKLESQGYSVNIKTFQHADLGTIHSVRVMPFYDKSETEKTLQSIKKDFGLKPLIRYWIKEAPES